MLWHFLRWVAGYLGLALVFVWGGAQLGGGGVSSRVGGALVFGGGLGAGLSLDSFVIFPNFLSVESFCNSYVPCL